MDNKSQTTRRDLLGKTVKAAAAAGLISTAGYAAKLGPRLSVVAGPAPGPIKPDRAIRVGLVGVGGRGSNLYNAVCGQKEVIVKAIADPSEPNRNQTLKVLKEKRGWTPEVYTGEMDYRKLMARKDIDAVVLATPVHMHAKMYLACFEHGKHFYGEKPMCIEVNEVNALTEAQKKNPKVIAQIGFQRRASELYKGGIGKIREGAIGQMLGVRASWNNSWGPLGGKANPNSAFWYGRSKLSGDWMLEQACHSWDVICWVMGKLPVAANGIGRRDIFTDVDPERDVTDYYYAHLEFPNKIMVDFEHCWCCPQQKFDKEKRFNGVYERFIGRKGGIDLNDGIFCPRSKDGKVFTVPGSKSNQAMTRKHIEAFFKTVRAGGKSIADIEVGRMASLTGILVRKAVYEKRRVLMSEIL